MKKVINKVKSKLVQLKNYFVNYKYKEKNNFNRNLIFTFLVGVLLISATYAWFYASLNVKVNFFNMIVSNESGLYISFDGKGFGSKVEISRDNLIYNLNNTYPNHTNQWASRGLYTVSTNGISSKDNYKFDVFAASNIEVNASKTTRRKLLSTKLLDEDKASDGNSFIAFDIFLKNASGSPYSDNLYLTKETAITFDKEIFDDADGSINSIRLGFVKIGSVPIKSDLSMIQNIKCNNNCEMIIYEPNSRNHSQSSIERALKYGVKLIDGIYTPTFAVIKEGEFLEIANGHAGSGVPTDLEHFKMQENITDFDKPLFQIPNGITKVRVYVWIEGQDMDSLVTNSKGAAIDISIQFFKDLAGYE